MYQRAIEDWLDALPLRRQVVAYVRAQGVRAYLVGGTVRDALLGRQSYDLDLAIEGQAMALARQVADKLHAAYVPLDAGRDVARVVVRVQGSLYHFDFARLRAEDIEADLWARDYTINAMAVSLQDPLRELLDPTGGQRDLVAGVLRAVREDAFREDPLRILRGVRLRGVLGFTLTPETEALARAWLHALTQVSFERIRDELVQVLELQDAASSLAYAGSLGVLAELLPELGGQGTPLTERAVRAVASLEELFGPWASSDETLTKMQNASSLGLLQRYRPALARHWAEELSSGHTRWVVLKLAALLGALPETLTTEGQVARRLRCSGREIRFVDAAIAASRRLLAWGARGELGPVAIYRYFRDLDDAGVDGALLSLAVHRAQMEKDGASETWAALVGHTGQLLNAWFDQQAILIDPPQLLSGHDLLQILEVKPGPEVGQLLQALREAQVQGLVNTPSEALEYLRKRIRGQASGTLPDTGAQGQHKR